MSADEKPAWFAEAKNLRELGVPISAIARRVGVDRKRIYILLDPDYAERQRAYMRNYQRQRRAKDPAYRAHVNALSKRYNIRKGAREEAAETGEPVEQVYERWGVA